MSAKKEKASRREAGETPEVWRAHAEFVKRMEVQQLAHAARLARTRRVQRVVVPLFWLGVSLSVLIAIGLVLT